MRISTSTMTNMATNSMGNANEVYADILQKITSGKNFTKVSENVADATKGINWAKLGKWALIGVGVAAIGGLIGWGISKLCEKDKKVEPKPQVQVQQQEEAVVMPVRVVEERKEVKFNPEAKPSTDVKPRPVESKPKTVQRTVVKSQQKKAENIMGSRKYKTGKFVFSFPVFLPDRLPVLKKRFFLFIRGITKKTEQQIHY